MKHTLIGLFAFWSLVACGAAADQPARKPDLPLEPLIEALDTGGLEKLNSHLDGGGKWPRITSDSLAAKEGITRQGELVALSDRLLRALRERAKAEVPVEIKALESDAGLLFSLGEKLWKADGYRNRATALLCCEFASCRCGQILILTKGGKMGPALPAVFIVRNPGDMLTLFIWGIPEIAPLAGSGLKEKLEKEPVTGNTWLEMLVALRKIELDGSTVGKLFNEEVSLRNEFLGTIISREDLSSLVMHQGWACVTHDAMLPALAMYLRNNGSLEQLRNEPTNATKFEAVMKDGVYRFSTKPVMRGLVGVGHMATFVEDLQNPDGISKRLFGADK